MTSYSVTGPRDGPSSLVRMHFIRWWVDTLPYVSELHHGDCVGVDAFVANLTGLTGIVMPVIAHPSDLEQYWANAYRTETRAPRPPLVRNRDMVDESQRLIAMPSTMYEVNRSGTWMTMRYARDSGVPVTVFWPDGTIGPWPAG